MSAFFFGPSPTPLFGYFHDAQYGATRAVLLCAAWGREYQFAHRALRVLGRRLAERGVHTLRFDYRGTGDSWGDTCDGDVSGWLDDITCAVHELRARSGCARVRLVGLRLGGLLAGLAAARAGDVDAVLLWDPPTRGADWLVARGAAHDDGSPSSGADAEARVEFDGQVVTARWLADVRALTLTGVTHTVSAQEGRVSALVLRTQEPPIAHTPRRTATPVVAERHLPDAAPWLEHPSIWSGLVPSRVIDAIVVWALS